MAKVGYILSRCGKYQNLIRSIGLRKTLIVSIRVQSPRLCGILKRLHATRLRSPKQDSISLLAKPTLIPSQFLHTTDFG